MASAMATERELFGSCVEAMRVSIELKNVGG
jgi:hypothetical protein